MHASLRYVATYLMSLSVSREDFRKVHISPAPATHLFVFHIDDELVPFKLQSSASLERDVTKMLLPAIRLTLQRLFRWYFIAYLKGRERISSS